MLSTYERNSGMEEGREVNQLEKVTVDKGKLNSGR